MTQDNITNEQFTDTWNQHIEELTRLGWNLNEEDYKDLKEKQEELKHLVQKAADNRTEKK